MYIKRISSGNKCGLCSCIGDVLCNRFYELYIDKSYRSIIPKFNPKFLGGEVHLSGYWWEKSDTESRIKAFDKLIEYYKP